jgi:DNA invertase Pin-like site-specific DNA recombinase
MKVVIYSRVSTAIQDYQRQTNELIEYSSLMNWKVEKIFQEKVSGAKKNEERAELLNMIDYVKQNDIKKVLSWELSRIGRNSLEVLKTINLLHENKISLYIKNHNIETLDDKGEINPMSQFMIQILSSVSEMERTTTRQRIKSGYDNFRKDGGKVGRKTGYKKEKDTIIKENKDVLKLLNQGFSIRKTMKLTDKSSGLVQKVKKLITE